MTPLDFILLLIVALFVVYLVIVAASEPRTTWRNYMTLDEVVAEMQTTIEQLAAQIGTSLMPVFQNAVQSMDDFSDRIKAIGDALKDDKP